jgi:hypothetical protein
MNTVWKYQFPITDRFELEMPVGARILTAFMQGAAPCLWAEVTTDMTLETRRFALVGTGNPRPSGLKHYIATFAKPLSLGPVVIWHLYEAR